MVKIVCIIQARMGSTRLPGKIMKKVKGKTILYYVVERVKQSKLINQIIIATTTNIQDDLIVKEAERLKIGSFRGSEDDVLSRYYYAAKENNADVVVRITSDCPLIDPKITDKIIKFYVENATYDLVTNAGLCTKNRTFPRGLDTEVFSYGVLQEAFNNATETYQREHVTTFFYENNQRFKIYYIRAEGKLKRSEIRITLDTKQDFKLISKIINHFKNIYFKTEEVIDFLDENPELLKINEQVKQKSLTGL